MGMQHLRWHFEKEALFLTRDWGGSKQQEKLTGICITVERAALVWKQVLKVRNKVINSHVFIMKLICIQLH